MIQVLLIAVIAGLALAHLWPAAGSAEGFTDTDTLAPGVGVHPAPMDEPAKPLDDAADDNPLDLPWIASWSATDREARRGQNCLVSYTEVGPNGTTIQTVSKSCEDGMPHTRAGDRIIIPDSVPQPARADIIRHEMVHIYQRRKPDVWATFYRRNWGFELFTEPPAGLPKEYVAARRANPDTWSVPWPCWQGRWWPIPVYMSPKSPRLREARTVWWDSWRSQVLEYPPESWSVFFGSQSQDEHPHELAAVMLVANDTATEAGRRLQNWWQSEGLRQGFTPV